MSSQGKHLQTFGVVRLKCPGKVGYASTHTRTDTLCPIKSDALSDI